MALKNETNINAGDSSTNNQAQTINNNYNGLTYIDAKNIAIDVFKDNFLKLRDEAAAVAIERATEIAEKLISRLATESPESLDEFKDPGMIDSLYQAQKEYAKNGDEEVADMLVEILIERAKTPQKNRVRIVLDESLKIASSLTVHQLNLLSATHIIRKTEFAGELNLGELVSKFNEYTSFLTELDIDQVDDDISILEYLRLGSLSTGKWGDPQLNLLKFYSPYFAKGFSREEIQLNESEANILLIDSFHDQTKLQLRYNEKDTLTKALRDMGVVEERIQYIVGFLAINKLDENELKEFCEKNLKGYMAAKSIHNSTKWKSFSLTPVGTAIALSNLHRLIGHKLPLSIWIK